MPAIGGSNPGTNGTAKYATNETTVESPFVAALGTTVVGSKYATYRSTHASAFKTTDRATNACAVEAAHELSVGHSFGATVESSKHSAERAALA